MQPYVPCELKIVLHSVTVIQHLQALCVYVFLVIAWLVCLWSFWNSISFTCAYWGLKRLTFDFKESSCRLLWVSFHEQENQRTEILICDDMLIYSLELLHWPWTRDRLCVLIQCLPEVSHPSEFYIDSAITFKAKNVPHSQENNSERLLQKRSIIGTPWRHTCIHIQGCVLMHKQRPHTYSHTQYQQWLSFFQGRQNRSLTASRLPWLLRTSGSFSYLGGKRHCSQDVSSLSFCHVRLGC